MRKARYPLQPLLHVREVRVDESARELASRAAQRAQAEHARASAEQARADHDRESDAVREAERDALLRGELTALDLMRAGAWELSAQHERDALLRREVDAAEREAVARRAEDASRQDLASRRADAKVVENDRARWDERERKLALAKEEEAAAEVAGARRGER